MARNYFETKSKSWLLLAATAVLSIVIAAGLAVALAVALSSKEATPADPSPGSWQQQTPSESGKDVFRFNAVASDSTACSIIGDYILNVKGGNAIDAAVGALLCVGATNVHSAGIGGGSFLVYYNRSTKETSCYDFRETAPRRASRDMYTTLHPNASLYGGLAVAVPGEVAGLALAHSRYGKLAWKDNVEPVVQLLRRGVRVGVPLADAISSREPRVPDQPPFAELKRWMRNPETKQLYAAGDLIRDDKLADTMQKIADDPSSFYNGALADDIVSEIQEAGGIIDKQDLQQYRTKVVEPLSLRLSRGLRLQTMPPPSSGAVLSFILGIMDAFDEKPEAKNSLQTYTRFLHRIVEAFKFAYAKRSALGDQDFVNVTELVANMTSLEYARQIREKISDSVTHNVNFYGPSFQWKEDSGTAHLSIVDSDGNAVSVTSTINTYFGNYVRGNRTGILYNNEMDDFSSPNRTNFFNLPPSPSNFIEPGKRPMSSMSPVIVLDDAGNVQVVSGASGGTRITTSIAYNLARQIYLNETVKEASDAFRLHHQLVPNEIFFNPKFSKIPQEIREILEQKGHRFRTTTSLSAVQGIQRVPDGRLQANTDFRKPSRTGGF